ncbi:unnamed protein product [marine sediment metagenome]|uniref:PglZ domain-containing protein n=1 Tax=marine sediment metagenome TaxID=412755 RepID=X1QXT9_9ZZZZ
MLSFWSNEGEINIWKALNFAEKIISAIDQAFSDIAKVNSTSEMVKRYTDDWWKIDNEYKSFRLKTDSDDQLQTLSRCVRTMYRDYQNQLNEKFLNLISKQKDLSIQGFQKQSDFWEKVASSKKRRAVILVDALRFELSQDLICQCKKSMRDAEISCEPLIASLPTLTPIGMSFLIPARDIKIDVEGSNWQVQSNDSAGNLALLSERKKIYQYLLDLIQQG